MTSIATAIATITVTWVIIGNIVFIVYYRSLSSTVSFPMKSKVHPPAPPAPPESFTSHFSPINYIDLKRDIIDAPPAKSSFYPIFLTILSQTPLIYPYSTVYIPAPPTLILSFPTKTKVHPPIPPSHLRCFNTHFSHINHIDLNRIIISIPPAKSSFCSILSVFAPNPTI